MRYFTGYCLAALVLSDHLGNVKYVYTTIPGEKDVNGRPTKRPILKVDLIKGRRH